MALPEDEQRRLGEIERRLTEDDPQLARRLATRRPRTAGSIAALIAGVSMLACGVAVIQAGAALGSPAVMIIGAVIAVIVPAIAWLARR